MAAQSLQGYDQRHLEMVLELQALQPQVLLWAVVLMKIHLLRSCSAM